MKTYKRRLCGHAGRWLLLSLLLLTPLESSAAELQIPPGDVLAILTASQVNQELIDQGRATPSTLPFKQGSSVYEVKLSQPAWFVRYYANDPTRLKGGAVGGWVMFASAVRGLSVAQVRSLFALPAMPNYVSSVVVPAGTTVRLGWAGPITGWGTGGGEQFLMMDRISVDNYHPQNAFPALVYPQSLTSRVSGGLGGVMANYIDNLPSWSPFSLLEVARLGMEYTPPQQIAQALSQTSAERYDSLTRIGINDSLLFAASLPWTVAPTAGGAPSAASAKAENASEYKVWARGAAAYQSFNTVDQHSGYNTVAGGIVSGVTRQMGSASLGGAVGVIYDSFDWRDSPGDGGIASYHLGLYGNRRWGSAFAGAYVTGAYGMADVNRKISFPLVDITARSKPESMTAALGLSGGLDWQWGGWQVQPLAQAHLVYLNQQAFSEHNAYALDLNVEGFDAWSLRTSLSLGASKTYECGDGGSWSPYASLGWGLLLPLDDRQITASFSGQPNSFTVDGYSDALNTFLLGLGLRLKLAPGRTVVLGYDGEFGQDYLSNRLSAWLKIDF
ncbi:MAG: autotransporter outer membrane beta-barrel domain-containing protein [Proteobacteria bacterium]|nr:autotransporter outer membrane beta-barrel domain-containing protein [Pseudomonadota bacterium]MBU4383700.1 autotransporter outer membrane beta-barrel domain-containing protein [Pseudomonadota bacterium]MBU4605238.1 autotransporter outer membrane beta-barrel domain-containing protein [Pseudomonadota bacterium]MCG2763922.1 autotransporter outer membrane beta-barrel domain-containing protein [Desulfarculaceae bacterium]